MYIKSVTHALPDEILREFTRAEIMLAEKLLSLMKYTAKKQKSNAIYTCVSQKWLANSIGVSREWVSKCTNRLMRFGIIRITRRRKRGEQWQTNLYRVGDALKKGWVTAKALFLQAKSRVNVDSHIGTTKHISSTTVRSKSTKLETGSLESFESIMDKCKERIESWSEND